MKMEAEAYLERSRTSPMEVFCKNSKRIKAVNYFRKKAPPSMFDWILKMLLGGRDDIMEMRTVISVSSKTMSYIKWIQIKWGGRRHKLECVFSISQYNESNDTETARVKTVYLISTVLYGNFSIFKCHLMFFTEAVTRRCSEEGILEKFLKIASKHLWYKFCQNSSLKGHLWLVASKLSSF